MMLKAALLMLLAVSMLNAVLPDSMFTQVLPGGAASQIEAFQIVVAAATASVRI